MWAWPAAPQGVRAPPHGFAAANASQVGRGRLPVKAPLVQQRGVLLVLLGAVRLRHVQRRQLFRRGHKLIARGSQQELPPCACHGKLHGADVYIVGTAHISPQSIADVEELMSKVKPDAVVVELSRDRINSLYPMADSKSGSLQLDLDTTPGGFPVVLQTRSFDSETEGQLVIRHAAEDKVDVVNMRQPLASLSHSQWLEKAFQKHRYRSETVKIWPAIEFMMAMANQLFPLAQRAFYLSVGNLSQSGGEFAAAARAARQLRCPIILGDVENEDLFDPLGALEVTREDSWWVRLGGPLVRPHTGGVDLIEALKHVFAGTTKPGTGARIGAIYLALLVYGFYLDEKANAIHTDFNSVVLLLSAMSATNTLVAATLVFLLTATRDELLFRALAEAARTAVEKKGHGTVVLVCGVAHVNGIARYVAKANGSSN